jgi:tyrosine-protein phosphatase SIW14
MIRCAVRIHTSLRAACAAALIVTSSLAVPAAAQAPRIAIDNFGRVNDSYYRGAQPQGRDYAALAAVGVKTVIDLTGTDDASPTEAADAAAAGLKFVRIPLTMRDRPSETAVTRFLTLVNDRGNQPVYVHCQGGKHRTGAMTAVYRMTHDGWTADRAYTEMQQYKFGPGFLHAALKNFVYSYRAPALVAAGEPTDESRPP